MFEHFSFRVPRYGEDAVRKNPFNRKGIICAPEFEELFNSLFKGIGFDKLEREETEEPFKPRIVRVRTPDAEVDETENDGKPFRWRTEDGDEKDEEPVDEPPSIFDMLDSGKKFSDIVVSKPKHTDIYNQAFGLDDNGDPIPLPEDGELDDEEDEEPYIHEPDVVYSDDDEDEEDERDENVKNPFVFIANRLTFLAQTVQPIIFDTSLIETGSDYIKIAVNEDKTFPKIRSFDELGLITCKLNCCQTIRDEIGEFIKGTEYTDIFCFPEFISRDGPGTDVWAIKFICYKRK